ncbi:MAG TPA: hypothetical protein VH083_04340 [Myxococcales bacterium]|nr:hypothetical protein [Myxococcales bacterium]
MLSGILAIALLGAPATVAAPTTPAPAPAPKRAPGCTEPERHMLDYWLGDWDTFEPEGALGESQARAHVDSVLAGCVVHELYEQTDGLIGDSFLSYDSVTKKWQQTWLTNFGGFMFLTGTFQGDVLTLDGTYHLKSGKDLPHKITWKKEKGGVRETGMMSTDGGKTWTLAFDVLFLKHKEKA